MVDSPPSFDVRPVQHEHYREYLAVALRQFHAEKITDSETDWAWREKRWADQRLTAAWDGDTMVGTFRSWDGDLAVPGGILTADFVSTVTVSPTHRRRGVLTRMMTQDLVQAKESGVPMAYLIASSALIYGRYGYGVSSEHCTWTVDADPALFRLDDEAAGLTVELSDDAGLRPVAPAVYEAAYRGMPGAKSREDSWWDGVLGLAGLSDDEPGVRNALIVRDGAGDAVAFVRYKVKESSEQRIDTSELTVLDLAAATDAGYARAWQVLASIDLTRTLKAHDRPVSESLPWVVTDRRAARQSDRADFGWVRLLDVPAALSGRRYHGPGSCVIEVADGLGLAGGTFRLEVDESGVGRAEPTADTPDLTLDIAALGSVYLGQIPFQELAGAGRVTEHVDGAAAKLGALLWFPATSAVTHTWF